MVQRIALTLIVLLVMAAGVSAATWNADPAHSSVNFAVRHLVISTVNGKFGEFSGTLDWDGQDMSTGTVEFTVQIGSVDTDNEDRDKHLISPEFFDATQFPTMTFKSTKVILGEGNTFKLVGDLTIRGVTKAVTFDCKFYGTANFMKTNKAGFSAKVEIDRQDFGVSWSKSLDGGGLIVSDNVKISLELEFNEAS